MEVCLENILLNVLYHYVVFLCEIPESSVSDRKNIARVALSTLRA